jgi:predicted  nucleic acid-binding Zn-ribbon protein
MNRIEQLQQELLELKIETEQLKKENEKRWAETDKRWAETDKRWEKEIKDTKKLREMIFGIGRSQGAVAEEFFVNSIKPTQKVAGIQYDMMEISKKRETKKLNGEYDIVLINGKELLIIEVKYNAHLNDLEKFLTKQVPTFKKLFPEYKDYKHHLAFASFHVNEDFKEEALKNGVIILQRKGDLVETITN